MPVRPLLPALLVLLLHAPAAPAAARAAPGIPVERGVAEHTVIAYTTERDGVVERDQRVEQWVSRRRAKAVYTDGRTGEVLGACSGTRRWIRCWDRDPALELSAAQRGPLFLPSWAETGRTVRRAVARGWLVEREPAEHRGIAARRLVSTRAATGDAGTTTVLAERRTLALLFRQTRSRAGDGWLTSTEDVLSRERLRAADVDFRLNAPPGERVRTRGVPR